MTATVTQRLLSAMRLGTQYAASDLRGLPGMAKVTDNAMRSALFCLQKNGRVLKSGRCKPFWYSLNPVQPQVRSIAASIVVAELPQAPAPSWPAVRVPVDFHHAPRHLIAANDCMPEVA